LHSKPFAPLLPAAAQDIASGWRFHTAKKSVRISAFSALWLISAFWHNDFVKIFLNFTTKSLPRTNFAIQPSRDARVLNKDTPLRAKRVAPLVGLYGALESV
jgi:hypothetical protein